MHLHLEGAVAADTFGDLAAKHGIELPAHDAPTDLYQYDSLVDFLKMYSLVSTCIRDRDDFRRVSYECLARCAASGVRYVELFFSAESHFDAGIDYPTIVAGIVDGLDAAKTDHGIDCRLIPAINRELGGAAGEQFVEMVIEHRRPEVIGIGLDFNEDGHPPEGFVAAYELAAAGGLRRTSHAGEVGPAANVANSIDVLGCERVDHGYHAVDDGELLASVVESQIPFTVCPTTTTYTTVWRDLTAADHAIRVMADAGVNIMINSDDPAMFSIDLTDEYVTMHEVMGFSLEQITQFALNGVDAAWIDDSTKQQWRREWTAEIESMLATFGAAPDTSVPSRNEWTRG